jgi:hypothetical protein
MKLKSELGTVVLYFIALVVSLAVVVSLAGCGLFTRTQTRYVTVTVEKPLRVLLPPRKLHPWGVVAGGEPDCPEAWAFCIGPLDWAALELNYRYMMRRITDDFDVCGVEEK